MEWVFARRYLTARKSHSVINLIATVSVVAVAVPVAAMVILMSVFNGFEGLVCDMYAAVDADVRISVTDPGIGLDKLESIKGRISEVGGVAAVTETVEGEAIVQYRDHTILLPLRGIDSMYRHTVPIQEHMYAGGWFDTERDDCIIIGESIAGELGVHVPIVSEVTLSTLSGGGVGSMIPLSTFASEHAQVSGMFCVDEQGDRRCALIPQPLAVKLFGEGCLSHFLMVRLDENAGADVIALISDICGKGLKVTTRREQNSAFYAVMAYEKWGVFILSLIVLSIAVMSMVGTIVILVMEKRKERSTLASLGADTGFIRRIFVREGVLIAGLGEVIGLIIGIGFIIVQKTLHVIRMPEGAFLVDDYPVQLRFPDILAIVVSVSLIVWIVAESSVRFTINREK